MKKQLLSGGLTFVLCSVSWCSFAQNVGVGTTSPGTTLDVNGAITNRETAVAIASNAAAIAANVSQVRLTGTATANITITATTPPNAGQRLVIFNNTTGGFSATLNSFVIPNGQAMEFVYSNSNWRATNGGSATTASNGLTATSGNVKLGGTLTAATTVDVNGNNMTFTGSGANTIVYPSGNLGVSDGVGKSILLNMNGNSTQPLLQFNPSTTSDYARLGTAGSPLAVFTQGGDVLGTSPALLVNNNGNVGIGNTSPGSTLDVNGSFSGQYRKVTTTTATLNATDYYVVYGGAGAGTINLPTSTTAMNGRLYFIKNTTATYNALVDAAGSETIDGAATVTLQPGYSLLLINTGTASGTTWEIISFSSAVPTVPATTASNGLSASNGNTTLGGALTQATTINTAANNLTINSGTTGASNLVLQQLNNGGNQQLGVDNGGTVTIYNPTDKQFTVQTANGQTHTVNAGKTNLYSLLGELVENTVLDASKWYVHSVMNKTLKVASSTSVVYFNVCGGITIDPNGSEDHSVAYALFVDNKLRSVKNISVMTTNGIVSNNTFSMSGSVTNLTAGAHDFTIAVLPRRGSAGSTFYMGSNSAIVGGFNEFMNRLTTFYNVIDQ